MSSFDDLMRLLESFEHCLGNPHHSDSPLSVQQSLEYDEKESLAWPQLEFLQEWGYMDYLIPEVLGGKVDSLVVSYFLTKSIARRDLTTAIALALAFFGALPTWIAGSEEQKQALAKRIRQGDIGAFALTEFEHGSDLTANEMVATPCDDGWELSGQKWCINFATQGQSTTALCRTHNSGGLLGFSLFYIDKALVGDDYKPTPKLPTHGVRGLDISGFTLDKVKLPKDALIGKEQRGLEITYKVFQISRTLCACLSVGGADTALRLALAFSLQRQLYGHPAYDIPAVKQRLGEQFTQLLIADCTSLAIIRACTAMPEKMSFWSAIIKFLIPEIAEDIVEHCGIILGARAYLRTTQWALFQKIRRDISVVGLFDGSTQVNLFLIAGNLLPQATKRGSNLLQDKSRLEQVFKMSVDCPSFDAANLGLFTHGEDDVLAALMQLNDAAIQSMVDCIKAEITRLDQQVLGLRDQKLFDPRCLVAFRLAEHYCWIFAASCCLLFWHYNQDTLSAELKNTAWLELAIQMIQEKLHGDQEIDVALRETMADSLCTYYQENKLFSVVPVRITE